MGGFTENAARIFEVAESVFQAGHDPSDITILIGSTGGIRLIADSDWPLESLQARHGAEMAYRVSHDRDTLRLDGRSGERSCVLATAQRKAIAGGLLRRFTPVVDGPRRIGAHAGSAIAAPLGEIWRTLPGASD